MLHTLAIAEVSEADLKTLVAMATLGEHESAPAFALRGESVDVGRRVSHVTVLIGDSTERSSIGMHVVGLVRLFAAAVVHTFLIREVAKLHPSVVIELVGLAVAGCMLDANVVGLEILVQHWQAAAAKTLGLVGSANFRGERVFGRFARHASDPAPWFLAAARPRRRSRGAYWSRHWSRSKHLAY
jgi:hypothetical protein